jgi:hypothetical protein
LPTGRLDGLEIDASGTIRANYTNGQNNPLGKIVVANFNNQNGLKQIGNATYVETAVSGTAVSTYVAFPICLRPFWLLKFATTILPKGLFCPLVD